MILVLPNLNLKLTLLNMPVTILTCIIKTLLIRDVQTPS